MIMQCKCYNVCEAYVEFNSIRSSFKKQPFCVCRGPWNMKTPFAFFLLKINEDKVCSLKES